MNIDIARYSSAATRVMVILKMKWVTSLRLPPIFTIFSRRIGRFSRDGDYTEGLTAAGRLRPGLCFSGCVQPLGSPYGRAVTEGD